MFTLEERREIAKAALSKIENVEVISSDGMLWQLAKDLGAVAIVKGYRNEKDLAYEEEMARYNLAHNPNAPTQLLQSSEKLVSLSSTAVRERILSGLSLTGYLPEKAIALIEKIRSERA